MASLHWIASVVLAGGAVVLLFDLWHKNEDKIRSRERDGTGIGEQLYQAAHEQPTGATPVESVDITRTTHR